MKIISTIFLLLTGIAAMAQPAYEVSNDPKNGMVVFKGPLTFDDLQKEPTFQWLKNGSDNYRPRQNKVKYLRDHLPAYSMVVFLGTWCSDSHELVPQFLKVLREINYPMSQVTMYGVERAKATRGEEVKKHNVTLVPTIILFKDGKEAGRITETVKKSVEGDLAKIVNQ